VTAQIEGVGIGFTGSPYYVVNGETRQVCDLFAQWVSRCFSEEGKPMRERELKPMSLQEVRDNLALFSRLDTLYKKIISEAWVPSLAEYLLKTPINELAWVCSQIEHEQKILSTPASPLTQEIEKSNAIPTETGNLSIFVLSNEEKQKQVIDSLQGNGGGHAGFSGWFNFDVMAKKRSSFGLIFDYNPQVICFMRETLVILCASDHRHDFVKRIQQNVDAYSFAKRVRFCFDDLDEIARELDREGGWLHTDAGFAHIQALAKRGDIALLCRNVLDTSIFAEIRMAIEKKGKKVTSLYLSNVAQYCDKSKQAFRATVEALLDNQTECIFAKRVAGREGFPHQHVVKGISTDQIPFW